MVFEKKFNSIFDYGSAFKYDSIVPISKFVNHHFYSSAFSYPNNITTGEHAHEIKENSWISSIITKTSIIILHLLVILSFPLSLWIYIKKVNAMERIVLLRFGKLQPVRGPGFTLVLPLIDSWTRINLQCQTFTVSTSQLLIADGAIVEAKSDIEYQIFDVVSYVIKLKKQEKALKDLGLFCLTNIISEKAQDDLLKNRELIGCILKDELNLSVLKWGLEIKKVHLYSVNILKAAEPVDALGTVVNVLKATTGVSTQHTAAVFSGMMAASVKEHESKDKNLVDVLKDIISSADNKALLKDLTCKFQFDIIGRSPRTVYCVFEEGEAFVFEDCCELQSDVSVIMEEDDMKDFLNGVTSPLEAYMDGRMKITGNWMLLKALEKLLGPLMNF